MTDKIENYEVLNIIKSGTYGTFYLVKHKTNSEKFTWQALNTLDLSEEQKCNVHDKISCLKNIQSNFITRFLNTIVHDETAILYVVLEPLTCGDLAKAIKTCKKSFYIFKELFIWRTLYQITSALEILHRKCADLNLNYQIIPENIFLDQENNVKLGNFNLISPKDEYEAKLARNTISEDIESLGTLIFELCTLKPQRSLIIHEKYFKLIQNNYNDLHCILILIFKTPEKVTFDSLLYHPSVLLKLNKMPKLKELYETNLVPADAKYSEDLSKNDKLENLQKREMLLRMRETRLLEKEHDLSKRERKLALMEKMIKEKMMQAELYLKRVKERPGSISSNSSSHKSTKARRSKIIKDVDSSLSADPGDSSIQITSDLMNADNIPKPNFLFPEKTVHFKPTFSKNDLFAKCSTKPADPKGSRYKFKSVLKVSSTNIRKKETEENTQRSEDVTAKCGIWNKENRKQAFDLFKMMDNKNDVNTQFTVLHTQL